MSALQSAITKEIKERIEKIKPEFSEYIIEDSFEYVPYETGKLAESANIDNKGNIIYYEQYAEKVYDSDRQYDTDKHNKATGHWIEKAYKDKADKWQQKLKDLILK